MPVTPQSLQPFSAALSGGASDETSFPDVRPLLAHYTSASTFEQIVKNDEIWLSNPLNMSDLEELRFGMFEGARAFQSSELLLAACGTQDIRAKLMSFADLLFARFYEHHALDTYVLCMSRHDPDDYDGVLSMWRGYGSDGSGLALVFDTAKITPSPESPFLLGKVDYLSRTSRLNWLETKLRALSDAVSSSDKSDDALESAAYAWFESIKLFSLFTKHSAFKEENEWRLAYMPDRDVRSAAGSMLGYHITERGVETKLKLKFSAMADAFGSDISLPRLVDRIILGPSISSVISIASLRRMLKILGHSDLESLVAASSIPYRPQGRTD